MFRRVILLVLATIVTQRIAGQGSPTDYASKYNSSQSQTEDQRTVERPDTLELRYYKIDRLTTYYPLLDTMLTSKVHNYDEARHHDVEYIHLGNQGSAALGLRYEAQPYIGFDVGYRQYDLYNFTLENLKFYEGNIPLVNAVFTPIGTQDNFTVKTDFTRSYTDGITVSTNYRRINQAGIYQNEDTKVTNLAVSIRYQHPGQKYTGYLSMISNVNEQSNSGGPLNLADLEILTRGNRELISSTLTEADTRHQQKYYNLTNYYQLTPESKKLQVLLRYDLGWDARYYKYTDDDLTSVNDDSFYLDLVTDERGLRHYTFVDRLHNSFYAYLTDSKRLNIRTGIVYDRYNIDQDIVGSSYNNLYLDMDGSIPFYKSLTLQTTAQLGLGDGAGDFNVSGALDLDIGKVGSLSAGLSFYRHTPSLLERSLYVTQVPVWDNSFAKPVGTDLYASLSIPYLNLRAELHQHVVTNAIYFDENAKPTTHPDIYTNTNLSITQTSHYSIFHLENSFLVQLQNENIYGLPTYWSRHNFYMQFYMFKKNLLARWGAETRLSPTYNGVAYNPGVGAFHLSGEQTVFYPNTDIYFSGKVKKFRLFVKLENIGQLINANYIDYRVHNRPTHDWAIRFGVAWLFLG